MCRYFLIYQREFIKSCYTITVDEVKRSHLLEVLKTSFMASRILSILLSFSTYNIFLRHRENMQRENEAMWDHE